MTLSEPLESLTVPCLLLESPWPLILPLFGFWTIFQLLLCPTPLNLKFSCFLNNKHVRIGKFLQLLILCLNNVCSSMVSHTKFDKNEPPVTKATMGGKESLKMSVGEGINGDLLKIKKEK